MKLITKTVMAISGVAAIATAVMMAAKAKPKESIIHQVSSNAESNDQHQDGSTNQ